MANNVKDKLFMLAIIVISFLAGIMLMRAISNYKNDEELDAIQGSFTNIKAGQDESNREQE